jgi:hypothetical protein
MWNESALRYWVSIAGMLSEMWDLVIHGAWNIAQDKKASHIAVHSFADLDSTMPRADERELLAEGDEVEDDEEVNWDACELLHFLGPFLSHSHFVEFDSQEELDNFEQWFAGILWSRFV